MYVARGKKYCLAILLYSVGRRWRVMYQVEKTLVEPTVLEIVEGFVNRGVILLWEEWTVLESMNVTAWIARGELKKFKRRIRQLRIWSDQLCLFQDQMMELLDSPLVVYVQGRTKRLNDTILLGKRFELFPMVTHEHMVESRESNSIIPYIENVSEYKNQDPLYWLKFLHRDKIQQLNAFWNRMFPELQNVEQVSLFTIDHVKYKLPLSKLLLICKEPKVLNILKEMKDKPVPCAKYNQILCMINAGGSKQVYLKQLGNLIQNQYFDHPLFHPVVLRELFSDMDTKGIDYSLGECLVFDSALRWVQ
jgi:hypothetical protein